MKKFLFFGILLILIHALFGATSATEPTNVSDPICDTPATVYDPGSFARLIENLDSRTTLRLYGSEWDNTLVRNCKIHDTGDDGIVLRNVSNVVIYNCEIWNTGNTGRGIKLSGWGSTENVTIDGNYIHDIGWDGVYSAAEVEPDGIDHPGLKVLNNRIVDVGLGDTSEGRHPIYLGSQDPLIEGNIISGYRDGNGISIRSSGIIRCNNVSGTSRTNRPGIRYFSDHQAGPSNTLLIEHNTVVDDNIGIDLYKPAIRKDIGQPPPDHVVKNFIIRYNTVTGSPAIHVDSAYDDPIYSVQVYDNQVPYECGIPDPDDTPPTIRPDLLATPVSESQIDLTWEAASDPESGVSYYKIYRDGAVVGQTFFTSYSDTGLAESTIYTYEVSAVNCQELESELRAQASATTLQDKTSPTIVSVEALDDPYKVTIVYSEPVEVSSATNPNNYVIDNVISVSAAALGADLVTITLGTSELSPDITYILTVNNVRDRAATPNTIASDTQIAFTFIQVPKVHVEEILMGILTVRKKHLAATAQVLVLNSDGVLVANADVTGMWSGLVSGTQTGLTGDGGIATFESRKASNSAIGNFVFTVTDVTALDFVYDPEANVVESDCIDTKGIPCTPEPPGGVEKLVVSGVDVAVIQVRKHWRGEASVTVMDKDASENTVAGATVTGYWEFVELATGSTTMLGSESADTDGAGRAVLLSPKRRAVSGDIFRFTVTDVTLPGANYVPPVPPDPPPSGSATVL